jgi:hypothetical protein
MAKADERKLIVEIVKRTTGYGKDAPYVRDLVRVLGIPEKRAVYILSKWASRDDYEYGVNVLAGWLTPSGIEKARSWLKEADDGE